MNSAIDILHIKSVVLRFGSLYHRHPKTELMHKQLIKLGAVLIFCREWYDLHNISRPYFLIWSRIEAEMRDQNIDVKLIPKIVQESEDSLTVISNRVKIGGK